MRKMWIGVGLLALTGIAPAAASGDYSCTQPWRLGNDPTQAAQSGRDCGDRPLLWPGNDSRSNLFLLLRGGRGLAVKPAAYPKPGWEDSGFGHSFFSWGGLGTTYGLRFRPYDSGGGSYCASVESGEAPFQQALKDSRALSAAERVGLGKARAAIGATCGSATHDAPAIGWPTLSSKAGKEFLAYLQAADAFYTQRWDTARQGFAALNRAGEPWVAETATYMAIRVELNAAQQNAFGDYGDFLGSAATDKAAVARAGAAIGAYLKRYPGGQYAASATGLKRRVAWLGGDQAALAREYEAALAAMPADGTGAADLIQEIDNKLLWAEGARNAIRSPLLLTAYDLTRMRRTNGDEPVAPLGAADLAAQKAVFAGQPELYAYLAATRALFVDGNAKAVLALVPARAPTPSMTPLAYSAQGLRGIALARLRDPSEEAHWRALIAATKTPYVNEFAQFGLALLWQRTGRLAQIFAPRSPVTDPTARQIVLARLAGADLLRAAIADRANTPRTRDVALFALLHKDLAYQRFADFARDRALLPRGASTEGWPTWIDSSETIPTGLFAAGKWQDGYACPALAATAQTLAANPRDAHARLCLGDFWRLNGFDFMDSLTAFDDSSRLGGGKSQFPGTPLTRAALYAGVRADAGAAPEARAYALYRSVMCYAPSGNNSCGGDPVDGAVRKQWYYELKQRYPSSRWAQTLRYYW